MEEDVDQSEKTIRKIEKETNQEKVVENKLDCLLLDLNADVIARNLCSSDEQSSNSSQKEMKRSSSLGSNGLPRSILKTKKKSVSFHLEIGEGQSTVGSPDQT